MGRYKVLRQIGQGGFGVTYLAEDTRSPQSLPCVIKLLRPDPPPPPAQLPIYRRLFAKEAETLAKLGKHPQIPALLHYFEKKQNFYIIQEFIEGQTLEAKLAALGQLPEPAVIDLLRQVFRILQFVHSKGVIHRDLKPANLIQRPNGQWVLIDFGVVKDFSAALQTNTVDSIKTRGISTTVTVGSAGYMPSEQLRGKPLPVSDLYGLGMVAIEALTGRHPTELDTDPDTAEVAWRRGVQVSDGVGDVLTKLVHHHYSRRYSSAQEALTALEMAVTTPQPPPVLHFPAPLWVLPKGHPAPLPSVEFQPMSFEGVTVNEQGGIHHRRRGVVQSFREELELGVELVMVAIPGGEFTMGSHGGSPEGRGDEGPQRWVKVAPFFMGQYAVTQAQYRVIMNKNPSRFTQRGANRPVEQVSWLEATIFCERLAKRVGRMYRLPSEAEWEYACRAGTDTPFHFGPTIAPELANYNGHYGYGQGPVGIFREETTEVGQFPPNDFGLYDMHGNVWEWCQDHWHGDYGGAPNSARAWLDGGQEGRRVLRGGAWVTNPLYCRSRNRHKSMPTSRHSTTGFRVVCSVAGP